MTGFLFLVSCEKLFLGETIENTKTNNFEVLWNDFNDHYGRFKYKNIDWDSVYTVYRPQVNESLSEQEFFTLCAKMVSTLKDGHAILESEFNFYVYPLKQKYSCFNANVIVHNYLSDYIVNEPFVYGKLTNEIAYLYIANFMDEDNNYLFIDDFIDKYKDFSGIVLDVRNNGGGDEGEAKTIASRFTDKSYLYKYNFRRNGMEHDDFAEYKSYINPAGNNKFLKKVVVLQNHYTGSAAEDFILMMQVLPNATIIGDYSSGNVGGCPITRELPNGWAYRIPTCEQLTPDKKPLENIGIEPDIYIVYSINDETNGRDLILDKAIELLSQ